MRHTYTIFFDGGDAYPRPPGSLCWIVARDRSDGCVRVSAHATAGDARVEAKRRNDAARGLHRIGSAVAMWGAMAAVERKAYASGLTEGRARVALHMWQIGAWLNDQIGIIGISRSAGPTARKTARDLLAQIKYHVARRADAVELGRDTEALEDLVL